MVGTNHQAAPIRHHCHPTLARNQYFEKEFSLEILGLSAMRSGEAVWGAVPLWYPCGFAVGPVWFDGGWNGVHFLMRSRVRFPEDSSGELLHGKLRRSPTLAVMPHPAPSSRSVWFYHAMALTTALIWSFSYIHVIWLSEHVSPTQLVGLRMNFFGLAIVAIWLWRRPKLSGFTLRHWLLIIAIGLVGGPGYHLMLAWGAAENRIEASLMGLIIATVPIHVGWLAWLALGERLTLQRITALALGLGGILLVVYGQFGEIAFWQPAIAGPVAVTIAAMLGALNTVMSRGARTIISPLDLLAISGVFSVVACLAYQPFVNMGDVLDMPWTGWWAAFYLGIPAIGVAYFAWFMAVSGLPAVSVAMYLFLTSVLSAFWAWLWQGNQLGWPYVLGSALVLSGLLTVVTARRAAVENVEGADAARPVQQPSANPGDDRA